MLKSGILNPAVLELLARFRHTNTLVIADRGFPFWREVPTLDLSLCDDVPTVRQVLGLVTAQCVVGHAWMASEFKRHNSSDVLAEYRRLLGGATLRFEPHYTKFKPRVPAAIGLIRTGDTTPFGNIILESA